MFMLSGTLRAKAYMLRAQPPTQTTPMSNTLACTPEYQKSPQPSHYSQKKKKKGIHVQV